MVSDHVPSTDFWRKFPERCCATVTREGEMEACEKTAIAVAIYDGDEYEWHAYPVCRHHGRGRPMMTLTDLIAAVRND